MLDHPIGITFRETMSGGFALGETDPRSGAKSGQAKNETLSMHASIDILNLDKFIADPDHVGNISGHISFEPFGDNIPAKNGTFNLFSPTDQLHLKLMIYELALEHDSQAYYLAGRKEVHNDPGFDLWSDTTTLYVQLHQGTNKSGPVVGAGVLNLGVPGLAKLMSTMQITNANSVKEQTQARFKFGKFFLGQLWETYQPQAK